MDDLDDWGYYDERMTGITWVTGMTGITWATRMTGTMRMTGMTRTTDNG